MISKHFLKEIASLFGDAKSLGNAGLRVVEKTGIEPATLCVQGRCSSQLSYFPILYPYIWVNMVKVAYYVKDNLFLVY